MPSNPSSKWFWNDWDNDKSLHLCSLAAQGLWMRMLSIAARATPLGYVTINGRSVDATDLAQVTGKSEAEIRCLVDELESRRVFSRDRHHRIYNRRMVRDDRARRLAVQNGKKGGNPRLMQVKENKEENAKGLSPPLTPPLDPLSLYPIPKKDSEPPRGVSDAGASPADPIKELWDRGKKILGNSTGAASVLGKLRKEHGDAAVMEAIVAAENALPSDPVSFIIGCLNRRRTNGHGHKQSPADTLFEGAYLAAEAFAARHYTDERDDSEVNEPLLDRRRSPSGS